DHRRRVQHRLVDGADLQLDLARVVKGLRKRDLVPAEPRLAHIDRNAIDALHIDIEDAAAGLEPELAAPGLLRHYPTDAPRAVAARLRERAVSIVDADEGIRVLRARIVQNHELVEIRVRPGCDGAGLVGRKHTRAPPEIDDHDLVSETVHLAERDGIAAGHGPI